MARSVNMAIIIGNVVRDPEMRYTPQGTAVTSFAVATNRRWKNTAGDFSEETEYHNIVAWTKLAELCSQLLQKGTRVYIKGRLRTRNWEDDQSNKHYKTEIVADDMLVLERGRAGGAGFDHAPVAVPEEAPVSEEKEKKQDEGAKEDKKEDKEIKEKEEKVASEEIPF